MSEYNKSIPDVSFELARKVAKQTEQSISEQLNDFISRGLIEVHKTVPQFVQSFDSNTVEIRQSVKLVLKDKEYIEKLESKIKKYEEIFSALNEMRK